MTTKNVFLLLLASLGAANLAHGANRYLQHNLVSDQTGMADHIDANLVNPWGICTSSSSPFWVSDNGTGLSTLYTVSDTALTSFGTPNATIKPVVPATAAKSDPGSPTGCVNNATATAFTITGKAVSFIFATENGSISGWGSALNAAQAMVMVDNSAKGAVYKGLAMATPSATTGPRIYATNFNSGAVEVYDQNWAPVTLSGGFTDPMVPAGFAPFNIQALGGKLYVTYAKQDQAKHDDVGGPGNGYVDVYDLNGALLTHLISGGNLNSPWGLAIAPTGFGDYANDLLVGNFGDGTINVYNPTTGALIAQLQNAQGTAAIHISGLWALQAGNGGSGGDANSIYFTAGAGNEQHGLFGSLQAAPQIPANAVVNAASYTAGIAPGGYVTIFGSNLAATQRLWTAADMPGGKLPTAIDGVSVTIDGKPAYIYYVGPSQISVIAPADSTTGSVQVVVTSNGLTSAAGTATLQTTAPAFFIAKNNYIVATHADGTLVGPTTLFPNNSTPAKAGETITLWGTGMGATNPTQEGVAVTTPAPLVTAPTVTINGTAATVTFAGLTAAGLDQINVMVPTAPSGDNAVVVTAGGNKSQTGALISVQ